MMKYILKISAIITVTATMLILAGGLASCEMIQNKCEPIAMNFEDNWDFFDNFVPDESVDIIGKWKLERVFAGLAGWFDYSQCGIVYEFRTNGVLFISGQSAYLTYGRNRRNSFSLVADDTVSNRLYINNRETTYVLSLDNIMILGTSVLDGNTYFFLD